MVTTTAIRRAKLQSNRHTNKPTVWLGGGAGLAINYRSQVRIPAAPLSSAILGKLLRHMCLSPSSIIWYQIMGGDALGLGR